MKKEHAMSHKKAAASGGGMYLLTYIGVAIYFVSKAEGFWEVVLALLKALVWPAYLINKIFTVLNI